MEKDSYAHDFAMVFCPRWETRVPWTAPAYLIEAVRGAGFSVQYLDYNIRLFVENATPELWNENIHHQFWMTQPLEYFIDQVDINEIDAPIVGFSLTLTNYRFSFELARRIKKADPDKIIICGGHHVFFEEVIQNHFPIDVCDVIVQGEGEDTLIDILRNGLNKNLGTFTIEGNKWVFNGERELIKNLDKHPWPRYEDINWADYPFRDISIMGSRGCIFKCTFCNDIVRAGYKFRKRSAENIAAEMIHHVDVHNVSYIGFNDPILNADYRHLDKLCDILLENNFDRKWGGNFSIRRNMPEQLMHKAKQAGLHVIVLGLESGSAKVLKLMKKKFDLDEAEWFLNAIHDAGIIIELNMIIGFPGETEDDFQQTLNFITKVAPKVSKIVSVATLNVDYSYLLDHLDEFGVILKDKDRHISWVTNDGQNTYDVRCKRAERLVKHAAGLGLTHDRYDADIERKDKIIDIETVKERRKAAQG